MHFGSCFDTGKWTKDHCGLYGRSDEFRSELAQLSRFHNLVCTALEQRRRGNGQTFGALLRSASLLNDFVVQIYHHRQIPDVLAVMRLIEQDQLLSSFRETMCENLCDWANFRLLQNDPRRHIF